MNRLVWLIAGFCGGVITAKNSAPMAEPFVGAIFLCMLIMGVVTWFAGYRGKNEAVATAVAVAISKANAEANAAAEAKAQAIAQQAINVYLQPGEGLRELGIQPVPASITANIVRELAHDTPLYPTALEATEREITRLGLTNSSIPTIDETISRELELFPDITKGHEA